MPTLAPAQNLVRIDRLAVDARLVMEMRARGAAGRAETAHALAGLELVAHLDVDLRQMAIACREPIAVVDLDHPAIAAAPAGGDHRSGCCHTDCFSGVAAKINAGMHRRAAEEGIDAHAEARRRVDLSVDRLVQRHRGDRRGQALCLGAGDVDAVDLLLERSSIRRRSVGNERSTCCRVRSLCLVQPGVGEYGTNPAGLGVIALFHGGERIGLTAFDAIERFGQAR